MTIKVSCACGKSLSVKDDFAGRKVKCPACQKPLMVPAAEEFAEDEFPDESDESLKKSRGGEKSAARGKGSKKGKKSSGSSRGLMIGLGAGSGVLVVALLVWMLWPSKSDVVADAPGGNAGGSPVASGDSTASPTTSAVASSLSTSNELARDLQSLQGVWQVSSMLFDDANQPQTETLITSVSKMRWTIKDDILLMSTQYGVTAASIKLDPSLTPKTMDIIPLRGAIGEETNWGIYTTEGDTWQLCLTDGNTVRPKEMKANRSLSQRLLTFQRSSSTEVAPAAQFDFKAWQLASEKLKGMKVSAFMDDVRGDPDGLTQRVNILLPSTSDGTVSKELWSIVSSISHVALRPKSTTDATLQQISQHPGLHGLDISGLSTITAQGIAELKRCSALRTLNFDGIPVSPEMLRAISQLNELRSLGINNTPISSEMLGSITQLSELELLSMQSTGTTDEDTLQIAKLKKLKALLLDQSKVTDTGLQSLKSLSELTMLSLRGLNVTPQGVADFEAALPKCKVRK